MSPIRRVLALAVTAALSAPVLQLSTAGGATASTAADRERRSYLVTTVGEFASVVRRDLGFWETTVELSSHRFGGRFTASELDVLRIDPRVASVEVNGLVSNNATQTDGPDGFSFPNDRIPWGLDRLDQRGRDLDGSYTYTDNDNGTGVTVYVVDSGVRATHVEFAGGRVQSGWDYRSNPAALNDYRSAVDDPDDPNDAPPWPCGDDSVSAGAADGGLTDQQGHGTHVSAAVVGATTGVAKGATVIPVRALDCRGAGTFVMVEEALKWIVSQHIPGTSGRAVVNLSLGVSPSVDDPNPVSVPIRNQINALVSEGVPVVIAAGNEAEDSCLTMPVRYEATIAGVVGVAASGWNDEEASFTNWGSCIDVYAPGVDVLSAYRTSNTSYNVLSGTSMAAPHVAGVIARMLDADPSLTPAQIDTAITDNATRCAIAPFDDYTTLTPNRLVSAIGSAGPIAAPCAPRITGGTVGNRSVVVGWTAPGDNGGSTVTGYTVSTSPSSSGCTTPSGTTTCTVSGLSAGQTYVFSVQATNAIGVSRSSVSYTGRPTGVPDSPTVVSATAALTTISATIGTVRGDSNSYTVTASPGGGTCTTAGTSCTISGLLPGTTYSLAATTTNVAGTSLASAVLTSTTASMPAVPSVSSSTAGFESVRLVWAAAANTTSYRVRNSAGTIVCVTVETTCVIVGLVGGVTQSFTVESVNSFGASASGQVTATPDAQVGVVPAVTVRPGNGSLTVSWSAATGNNVTYTAGVLGGTSTCTTTSTSCSLTGLVNGRRYDVYVVGANTSTQSATANAVSAYAGFTVKATRVKRSRKVALTSFVVPVSTGTRRWSEKGSCRISGRFLVTPSRTTTCTLTLKTAKNRSFAATSISLKISVT